MVQTGKALIRPSNRFPFYRVLNVNVFRLNCKTYISQNWVMHCHGGNEYMNQLDRRRYSTAIVARKISSTSVSVQLLPRNCKIPCQHAAVGKHRSFYHPECLRDLRQ